MLRPSKEAGVKSRAPSKTSEPGRQTADGGNVRCQTTAHPRVAAGGGSSALSNPSRQILVLNCGSSSIKFATFSAAPETARMWVGAIERIGARHGRFRARNADGAVTFDEDRGVPDHAAALDLLLGRIDETLGPGSLVAAGHRVAHGGPDCDCPVRITESVRKRLTELIPLAPLHQPHNLAGIAALGARRPDLLQVACFDTAFHHGLPRVARMTGLPREYEGRGIRRYGYHGLSYEYVTEYLRSRNEATFSRQRIVIAHLGSGASMTAIRGGRSIETTMGFSPLSGLPMGTRCGDLDPGIVLHLLTEMGMTPEAVQHLLYERSGLLGVSGISNSMEDLLAQERVPEASEAIELFCYRARAWIGALTAALGGLDQLVFTGGIGENAAAIRARVCAGLQYLGIEIDEGRNQRGNDIISAPGGAVTIEVVPTDEELMIARHTYRLVTALGDRPGG